MIYKSNLDRRWYKVNPNYIRFNAEQNRVRREAFSTGVFRVDKEESSNMYHLYVNGYPIGAWSPGDIGRARILIGSAFSTYYALTFSVRTLR